MELITSIILIVFAVLQIILFFKIWGMTNDVNNIKVKLNTVEENETNWKKDFAVLITLEEKERAKKLLFTQILNSKSFSELLKVNNDRFRKSLLETIDKEYGVYLLSVGESSFKFDETNKIYNVFK